MTLRSQIKKFAMKYAKFLINQSKGIIDTIIIDLYNEAWKMYDAFIDQYYNYRTTSYIRHEQNKPGTMSGINLYRGQNIKYGTGSNKYLDIEFTGSDMDGGYQYDSPENVLNNVMSGHRGVPRFWDKEWTGSYDGNYYSYSGVMMDAFNDFDKNLDTIAIDMFDERFSVSGVI